MESESSSHNLAIAAAEAERRRERHRVRARERILAMSIEEREDYLARRRNYYHSRRSRIASRETRTHEATLSTLPTNATSSLQPPAIGRSRMTPLDYTTFISNMASANHCEGSTSCAPHSNREDGDTNHHSDSNSYDNNGYDDVRHEVRYASGRPPLYHNYARDFHERQQNPRFQLPTPITCHHYQAKLFNGETRNFCCKGGKIILLEIPIPSELYNLFIDQSVEGRIFRKNICAFNHVFSFTSMSVKLDESVATGRQGVYAFRAHGSIYHRIGTLLPLPGMRPRYIQMFIYDTEHEIENRLLENDGLNRDLIEKIKRILDAHNPFVQTLRQLAQRPDINDCKLLIKERPITTNQYILPTTSQVAAVIVGSEEITNDTTRDIIVQTIGGHLMNVKEISGYYDPLQYPLLHPYGTYGWDSDSCTNTGSRVTCCDYYAYMLQIRMHNPSILLYGGCLLQQYVVGNYVKIETQKLRYIRTHQRDIRAELYQGLQDCLNAGETNAGTFKRRLALLKRMQF